MFQIAEPIWIRSVTPARNPIITSDADRWEYSSRKWCSESHAYLNPDLSACFTSSTSWASEVCS